MSPIEMSNPAGVLTVPLGVVDVCQAGTSLTQPQSSLTVPPRLGSMVSIPSLPSSPASSVIATTGGARALGDADGVADVVRVAVREQDRGGLELVGLGRRLRVAGQERVDQHGRVAGLELEGRVAQVADVHCHSQSPWVESISRCASSYPTAAPMSMLTRVSSAINVRTAVMRSSGSAVPAARSTSA